VSVLSVLLVRLLVGSLRSAGCGLQVRFPWNLAQRLSIDMPMSLCERRFYCRKHRKPLFPFAFVFLPCDALRCTVFVIVILSVRPSVCPSVTLVDCVHTVQPTIMISSPYGSPIILVPGVIKFIPKFDGDHPERGRWMRLGWVRIGDFRPISRRIS